MRNVFTGLSYDKTPKDKPLPVGERPTEASRRMARETAWERGLSGNALVSIMRGKMASSR